MTELTFADIFPPAEEARWRSLVDKVLKGADFERRLVSRTADAIPIAPLYARPAAAGLADPGEPGAAPFTRGSHPALTGAQGWIISQVYADEDPAAANAAILDDLAGGVAAITLQIAAPGQFGLPYHEADLARALDGVVLEVCPVTLKAGEYTPDAAGSLMALWRRAGLADAARVGAFDYDPLGTLASTGALYHPVPKALALAADLMRTAAASPNVSALTADGHVYHAAGASEAQEIAAVLATLVAYLRAAEAAGIAPADALPRIAITLAVDADQFLGLAKLRAARRLVWRLAESCGAGDTVSRVAVRAQTASRMMTRRDPWVNMLRTTIACAAAAMGGASQITVLPFTWALGQPDAFARRIARNTHHVLMEEAGLDRVADPAGGSWYVERLTHDLAAKAWEIFQAIEGKGGMGAALASGFVRDEIGRVAKERARRVATGRLELTGASAYPRLGDDGVTAAPWPDVVPSADLNGARTPPLPAERLAEPFERLRDAADAFAARTGAPPRVFLAALGPLAVHAARATWITNFLAAGGIAAIATPGFTATADLGRAFADSGAGIACLCSSDEVYGELGEAAAGVLKAAGAAQVWLAGRPKAQEAALQAAGVDDFIFAGCDALAVLARLHRALGIA